MFSNDYINQLKILHSDKLRPQGFGGKVKDLGDFYLFMNKWKPKTLLDYGCGKGNILMHFIKTFPNTTCVGYDPAVEQFSSVPTNLVDCVFSNDVLEHIEPKFIVDVLTHINKLSNSFVWLRIDTLPARKFLADGRNAHLIQQSDSWWHSLVEQHITGNIVYTNLNKKGKLDIAIEK